MSAVGAQAQFNFVGTTRGCFYNTTLASTCTPVSGTASFGALSFTGNAFNTEAIDGMASFNTANDNFGNFILAAQNRTFTNVGFLLQFTVSSPAMASGGATASVTGRVTSRGASSVNVDFANNDFFALTPLASTVRAQVNDVSVQTVGNNYANGRLAAAVVPEPSTYALMGAGLLGLAGAVRRRRAA